MTVRSLDQQRAAHALARIDEMKGTRAAASYVKYVKALPAAILGNGLGQALATELAARDAAHDKLAEHIAGWLLTARGSLYAKKSDEKSPRALLNCIVGDDQRSYVWAQAEAIAYAGWLKKLAVAFLSTAPAAAKQGERDAG